MHTTHTPYQTLDNILSRVCVTPYPYQPLPQGTVLYNRYLLDRSDTEYSLLRIGF